MSTLVDGPGRADAEQAGVEHADAGHATAGHATAGHANDTDAAHADAEPDEGRPDVVRDRPDITPVTDLRRDFGAHIEAEYRRLVAQLFAITLNSAEAHDAVQDAYSRAWRSWATVGRSADPAAWVRRVAVGSTIRSWRRISRRRPRPATGGVDPRAAELLGALARLPVTERRAIVLYFMAGVSLTEIAAVERTSVSTVTARLRRAQDVVSVAMADLLPDVLGSWSDDGGPLPGGDGPPPAEAAGAAQTPTASDGPGAPDGEPRDDQLTVDQPGEQP